MGNEGQQPPLPGQGYSEQQGYYGWQYDQDYSMEQQPPVPPPPSPEKLILPPPSAQMPPGYQQPAPGGRQPMRPQYQEPILDMGTSLGYGQGMEYQYFDTPQPSQPMAQLRLERLQQLREERMRRQQRRLNSDITTQWSNQRNQFQAPAALPPQGQMPPAPPVVPGAPPPRMSPVMSVSPPQEVAQARPKQMPSAKPAPPPAAAPAQDTGMIQRLRIGRATLILTGAFVASRILGLLRTSMFAFVFGTSTTSDAYLQAFLIPDLIFNIVAGGALSSAFIPVFTKYMIGERDEKSAWHIASSALNLSLVIMVILATIAIIFEPWLVPIYNPGIHDPQELALIASLTRIMLLQSVALGSGVIITAVLNSQQDFRLPAIGTVLYNVGLIAGLIPGVYFAFKGQRNDQLAAYAATWGVVLGAILQVGFQIPGLFKVGMRYSIKAFDVRHPGVIQIARQMVPRIINAAMLYSSTFVDRGLIQMLGAWVIAVHLADQKGVSGLITQYSQSFQLVLLPLGIFGMSVSTAAFPTLAENVAKGRLDRVRNTILETLRSILFMSIPSCVGLIVLGFPIIQVLLQHGRFNLNDTQSTTVPLTFYALGLPGLAAVEILTRSFYALRDSITPVIVSVGQFIFKIALSLLLINTAVWGFIGELAL
ncbi:murein biosynthesis integral membrane protein MurJ [Ktedonosporobacter rubrisoli]|uniref:Murein biosynthesis integral membrane protein MurJ n=1 Tax=Ktedonosporobacter rubrisoli TaxID=2509675 RepID=A0A4P6JRP1_KTERU|nr:murein biosynthesis integral membrane protein MurJ [Ktedonosporobacter rubrisoli]QBD78024.1 murein biosynthesis integral membrane protein MurJ [Ktedonosporobacter rubrisoli]